MKRVFLAAPFTDYRTGKNGELLQSLRRQLQSLLNRLRAEGYEVFSAHEREKWGLEIDPQAVALEEDWYELRKSDILIAILGNPISPGVQMEIGIALQREMKIIVFAERHQKLPYLIEGLRDRGWCHFVQYSPDSDLVDDAVWALKHAKVRVVPPTKKFRAIA